MPAEHSLVGAIDGFADRHVVVVGDAMLDSYLHGVPRQLCPEAPVPIVDVAFREDAPGGAANTAVNVAELGANVALVAVIGDDAEGDVLHAELERRGVDAAGMVRDAGRRTLSKQRILADDQMVVRCDVGSTHPVESPSAERLRDGLRRAAAEADAVVVSDYAYGVVGPDVLDVLAELHGVTGPVVVDARDITRYRRVRPTVAKPNYREAVRALGLAELEPGEGRLDQLSTRADDLLRIAGAEVVAVTLDGDGALVFERDRPSYRSFADRKRSIRTAGAGDTFTAAFSLALTAGLDTPAAADIASAAAGVVVEADGTGICSAAELRVRLASAHKVAADVDVLEQRIRAVRDRGGRIVFTNGCFDILHRGHITSLNEAKQLGDFLVVGLNSDDGVRRLKGDGRPINRLDDRAEVLAALSCVDAIVPFDEDSPVEIIRGIRPDVFAKGGDYTAETLPEASVVRELGGEVQLLQFVPERSTTGIIRRIQSPTDGPRAG